MFHINVNYFNASHRNVYPNDKTGDLKTKKLLDQNLNLNSFNEIV